jgi:4-amino-4-deoxy-L-arabinose transferase-like glycosyltransferase
MRWNFSAYRLFRLMDKKMKRSVWLIILFAFLFRMGLGMAGNILLPQIGYESKTQKAGYLFYDAYRRDTQAWDLAQSKKPLSRAFEEKFSSDQYGGLLWLIAFVYRYLSLGSHQPLLIVALAALVGALGVWFVYRAAKRLLGEKGALLAALIFAFFPEAILQGAAQMREPFLMTFVAMTFYGLVEWQSQRNFPDTDNRTGIKNAQATRMWDGLRSIFQTGTTWWVILGLAGLYFISPGIVLVTLIATAGWVYFADNQRSIPWQVLLVAAGIFIIALLALAASWNNLVTDKGAGIFGILGSWAYSTAKWNADLLKRSSGIVQLLFEALPMGLAMPFVAGYGILQPVLPAAILEPALPFWQILGIGRSLGWYLLLPLVAFAPFSALSLPKGPQRRQWLWLNLVVWGWIVVAALRGGGDQWDNPRYRVILLVWLVLLAGQAFESIGSSAKRWLWRIIAVEAIILLVFGHWYVWRYLGFGFNLGIRGTLLLAMGCSILVLLGDWLWQRRKV